MKFRFSLRDMLLLTVIVAMAVGWWIDHKRMEKSTAIFDLMKSEPEGMGMALALDDKALYRVEYPRHSFGGKVSAYSLSDGKSLWKTQLQAIGGAVHFAYSNTISVSFESEGLLVEGHETFGDYHELLDCRTGKMLRHNVWMKDFSKREDYKQEEPK